MICNLYLEREKKWAKILYNKYLITEDPSSLFRMKILPKGSDSWNVMVKCHHIEINFLTLDVGTSEDVLFWEESWDGHPLIDNNLFHVMVI